MNVMRARYPLTPCFTHTHTHNVHDIHFLMFVQTLSYCNSCIHIYLDTMCSLSRAPIFAVSDTHTHTHIAKVNMFYVSQKLSAITKLYTAAALMMAKRRRRIYGMAKNKHTVCFIYGFKVPYICI